jgi:hypothetical protein
MRCVQCLGQRSRDLKDSLYWKATRRDQAIQRLPFDEFHRQKVNAFGFLH